MNKYFDVIVAKEFTIKNGETEEKRTQWNKVGRAWASQSGDSVSFELFLIPNQRYVVQLKSKYDKQEGEKNETSK